MLDVKGALEVTDSRDSGRAAELSKRYFLRGQLICPFEQLDLRAVVRPASDYSNCSAIKAVLDALGCR